MSEANIVMYAFRVSREAWWDFAKTIRDFYCQKHPLLEWIFGGYDSSREEEIIALIHNFPDEWVCRLQLFEEDDNNYIFRALENFDVFINCYEEQGWPVEPVFYDPHHPELGHREEHYQIAEWMDELIAEGRYFIYSVFSRHDFIAKALGVIGKARRSVA